MDTQKKFYDIAVIGAGHAGIEAALAGARLGCRTAVFTLNLDWIGNMACNPSIGGTSKGHLVREIDALGGEMGQAADACTIQSRMLNRGKGPAVHSLRAQVDRRKYTAYMKHLLECQENLDLIQAEIVSLKQAEAGQWMLESRLHAQYAAPCVILATGTFLRGRVYVGDQSYESGPDGMFPANALARSLTKLDLPLRRFKTGTPARVNRRSVDLSRMEKQPGDESVPAFSFFPRHTVKNQACCHITYTNEQTRQVILDNLRLSPLYGGQIEGKGPRYCPSFEDKVVRFPDKERHQLFVEPCGLDTEELYLQGLSSSMPLPVQEAFIHTIPGLEHAQIMRNAYAIEYDCVDPTALSRSLEFPNHPGLFGAGQFNGSSGYEEAAAQGLIAGINAACKAADKPPFTLDRASSYIGTLIDDLVTKGCTDPYRMMTSRSEYRLVLRQDNADVRLTPLGYQIGLISKKRYQSFLKKQELVSLEQKRLQETILPPSSQVQALLESLDSPPLKTGVRLAELMRRPNLGYEALAPIDAGRPDLPRDVMEQVEISIKYAGYIRRQEQQIREMRRLEGKRLPPDLDYGALGGLRLEAVEKLSAIRPENLGQAGRISGVTPADVSVLAIHLQALETRQRGKCHD